MFTPDDIKATLAGTAPRCVRMAVLTSQTCGEPCWHAREDVCRCSCGGANHGCLLIDGAARPERTAKIDGERYRLLAVGRREDIYKQADEINGRQWRGLAKPCVLIGATGGAFTDAEIEAAKAAGTLRWHQYYYSWRETDPGAPARIKTATKQQAQGWPELAGWKEDRNVCLLWERLEMPDNPGPRTLNDGTLSPHKSPNEERAAKAMDACRPDGRISNP